MKRAPKDLIYTPTKVLIFTRNILAKMFPILRNAFKLPSFKQKKV